MHPQRVQPVGIFDSGAGGLTVLAAIHTAMPQQPLVYFADTAYAPYGARSDREIRERTQVCCQHLLERGVQALVVACNTATANAIDAVRARAGVPVIGVEPGLKPAAAATRNGRVGVLATPATLASQRYRDLRQRTGALAPRVRFIEQAAVGWVELVEAGELESVRARALVCQAVLPLLNADVDTVVLGCTHYPFLRRAIESVIGDRDIIETGLAVAQELRRRLHAAATPQTQVGASSAVATPAAGGWLAEDGAAPIEFESSGDSARFAALAQSLLASAQALVKAPTVAHT